MDEQGLGDMPDDEGVREGVGAGLGASGLALAETEESFRLMVESVEDYAIFMLDAEGHVVTWNMGAERIKGWKADEIIGRHFSCFYEPEAVADGVPERELAAAAATGRSEDEGWRVRKNGSRFWASVIITAIRDSEGRLRGFGKVTRDTTERRIARERLAEINAALREANALQTQFLATTVHELGTPVTVIAGFAQTLADFWDRLDDETRTLAVEGIRRQTAVLTRLIGDLATASHLEAGGRIEVKAERVNVAEAIAGALEGLPGLPPGIDVDCPAGLQVQADRGRFEQILTNYLQNALRYGAAPISVAAARTDGWVDLRVRDAGPGVTQEFAERLFQKFARAAATASSVRGSGLGLFIVRGLSRAMGGDAWYEPNEPRGACFVLRLPAADRAG